MKRTRSLLDRYRLMIKNILVTYRMSFALGFFAVVVAAALIGQMVPKSIGARKTHTADSTTKVPAPMQSPSPCCGPDDDKPHLLVGSYYSLKDQLTAKLLLNNKGPQFLVAYPTLYSMSGERFDVGPVTVGPESFRMIDIHEWVDAAGPQFQEGSVQVFHLGRDLVLGAQVYLVDYERSLSFDEKLVETKSFKSTRLEGLWWMPSLKGQVRLALSNTSDAPLTVKASVEGHTPERAGNATIELGPHQTRLLNVLHDITHHQHGAMSKFGAISLEHSGSPGGLLARAMVQDASIGYSLTVQFSDPKTGKSSKLQGAGLRLGHTGHETLTPVVLVRNVGTKAAKITGRVPYTSANGDGMVVLPTIHLAAGEIVTVDVARALRERGNEHPDGVGGLEFEYSTEPGSVSVTALSVSDSGNQVFRVPMWDIDALRSSTGGYPWYIDGNSSTVVYLKNGEDHRQQYFIQVRYLGGIYVIGAKKIEPGQTITYDFRKLRDEQVPDNQGRVIPPYADSGQIHWSKVGPQSGVLVGRSEQTDLHAGISSNYACLNCCSDNPDATTFRVSPNSSSAVIGGSRTFTATVEMINCYTGGNDAPIIVEDVIWSSSNPDVAVVGAGVALAQGPGSTNIGAEWHTNRYTPTSSGFTGGFEPIGGSGECAEDPITYNATPASLAVVSVTISGPQSVQDGSFLDPTFTLTPEGGSPTSFQWSWTAPTGVGNNPLVTFNPTDQGTTVTNRHWFANPNVACPSPPAVSNPPVSTDPYYNSVYTIIGQANFSGGLSASQNTTLTVNAFWNPAGTTAPPVISGGPEIGFDTSRNLWVVVNAGTITRNTPVVTIHVPVDSQFYNKTVAHENRHVQQYQTGMNSDLFTVASLMVELSPLTDATQAGLSAKIAQAFNDWHAGQLALVQIRRGAAEQDAHSVSDPISPQYAYQLCQ